jgi:hypothetical protein
MRIENDKPVLAMFTGRDGKPSSAGFLRGASFLPTVHFPCGSNRKSPAQFLVYQTRPAWSPDGRVVAVLGYESPGGAVTQQVVAVDVATGAEQILPVRLLFAEVGPAWLDPGSLVVSGSVEVGAPSQLWRLSYPGGQLSRLPTT